MKSPLEYLFWDSRQIELRHNVNGRWITGWFDNAEDLTREALKRVGVGNLFTSLNRPLIRGVQNTMTGSPVCNDDIELITRVFFDFDPVRPTDTASTDEQLIAARNKAREVLATLRACGWPDPLVAVSGNGYHLQYRIALSNSEETKQQLKAIYAGLKMEFSDDTVSFDSSVRNPGRICTLYGSTKRKGPDTAKHRKSKAEIPTEWRQVRPQAFERVANFYATQQKTVESYHPRQAVRIDGAGDYSTLNVVAWFQAHGHYKRFAEDNKHYVRCPWVAEHSREDDPQGSDTLVYEIDGEGWPGFFCHHEHCQGRTIRDVMHVWGDADQFCAKEFSRA